MKKVMIFILLVNMFIFAFGKDEKKREVKSLSLKDSIYKALKNNLDLKVEITNKEYFFQTLNIQESIFIPKLNISFDMSERNYPSTGILSGAAINKNRNQSLTLSLSQKLALGGDLSVEFTNSRFESNSRFSTINPALDSQIKFNLTQPLLKGFGTFNTKKDIYININEYKKSKHQLKDKLINLIYRVEEAYWNLVYAYQNLDAQKKALERARKLLKENQIKVKVGTAAPMDILEAKADVALYESNVIQAEKNIESAEDSLKKILNISDKNYRIIPTDRPTIEKIKVNFNDFLLEALNNRPDIESARLDLKNYKIRVKYQKNQMLPDLQLTASYYTTGIGGDQLIIKQESIFGPREIIGVIKKDVWETMKDVFSNLYKNYSIGLSLSIPLSFKKERAELMQAKINLKKSLYNLKNIENNILFEVKSAIKELEANYKLVEANRIRVELEKQKLEAEQKKLSVGLSTNFQVLTYQRQYADAQTNYLKSVIDYKMTISKINKIIARTLKVYDINLKSIN